MLRARKVLSYVAERIESEETTQHANEQPDEWLELLCQEKVSSSLRVDIRSFLLNGRYRLSGRRYGDREEIFYLVIG